MTDILGLAPKWSTTLDDLPGVSPELRFANPKILRAVHRFVARRRVCRASRSKAYPTQRPSFRAREHPIPERHPRARCAPRFAAPLSSRPEQKSLRIRRGNSSPPSRPTSSLPRVADRSRLAVSCSTVSPTECPHSSLIALKPSKSMKITAVPSSRPGPHSDASSRPRIDERLRHPVNPSNVAASLEIPARVRGIGDVGDGGDET